jgi:hypothetical protein
MVKKSKGFVVNVTVVTNITYSKSFSTFAEALYEVRRYWNKTISLHETSITLHDVLLYHYNAITQKEWINMSKYETFRTENKNFDKVPYMDAADRAVFAKSRIPFHITQYRLVDGNFGKQIICDIVVDTTNEAYKAIYGSADVVGQYQLSFTGTQGRVRQFETLVQPDIDAKKFFILVANGRSFDLDLYEEA